jgi:hypothetical protein
MERPGPVNDYKYAIMRAMPLQNTRSHQRESVQSAELTPMTPMTYVDGKYSRLEPTSKTRLITPCV